ncbi:hypothetical protein [Paenirhodobacter sp.]|uniref:hypothetical protein n=1 Tax=Paenirhodobacter sp. TaxID=1965326 RepID=UPI003B423195
MRAVKGQQFALRMTVSEDFKDHKNPVPPGGAPSPGPLLRSFEWARRADAPWLAPVVQIGAQDPGEMPAPGTLCHADFVGSFTANRTGPLFLYANDVGFLPGVFYTNNSGAARVSITRLDHPRS